VEVLDVVVLVEVVMLVDELELVEVLVLVEGCSTSWSWWRCPCWSKCSRCRSWSTS
jgi:hypothetical protein